MIPTGSDAAALVISRLPGQPKGPVEVLGEGALAERLRERLGAGDGAGSERSPALIIDTSGSPEQIKEALRRLDDLGTLVLTRGVGGDVSVNLYADLHFRSLTVIGVMASPA